MLYSYQSSMNLFKLQANKTEQQENTQNNKRRTRIPFTKEEDQRLIALVNMFGVKDKNNWYIIANNIKGRSPRQCRERYQLFLSDQIRKKAKWTKEEDELLIAKYKLLGPHWKKMEQFFEGRTSYNIKNRFISLNRRFNFQKKDESSHSKLSSQIIENDSKNDKSHILDNSYHFVSNEIDFDYSDDLQFMEEESYFTVF